MEIHNNPQASCSQSQQGSPTANGAASEHSEPCWSAQTDAINNRHKQTPSVQLHNQTLKVII